MSAAENVEGEAQNVDRETCAPSRLKGEAQNAESEMTATEIAEGKAWCDQAGTVEWRAFLSGCLKLQAEDESLSEYASFFLSF